MYKNISLSPIKIGACCTCFILLFSSGYYLSQRSWNKMVFISMSARGGRGGTHLSARDLASTQELVQKPLSALITTHPHQKTNSAFILKNSQVEYQKDHIILRIAHPLVQLPGGNVQLACERYESVDMSFTSEGVSVHGTAPQMKLKMDCPKKGGSADYLPPFIIPKQEILRSSTHKQLFRTPSGGVLLFSHIAIRWPVQWVLMELRFSSLSATSSSVSVVFSSSQPKDYLRLSLL